MPVNRHLRQLPGLLLVAMLAVQLSGVGSDDRRVEATGIDSYCISIGAVQSLDGAAYCVKTFTSSATWTPPTGVSDVEYLVVGGGGGGRAASAGTIQERGGSGGSVVTGTATLAGTDVTVTVGAGGAQSANGAASSIAWAGATTISAAGGSTGAGPNGAGSDGPSSSITGAAVVYGSSGGKAPNYPGGTAAGRGANSSTNNCTGGGSATANRGGGGGGGDRCTIDFGTGTSYSYGIGGTGGSGVVIIRWIAFAVSSFVPSSTLTNSAESIDFTLTFTGDVDPASLTTADFGFSNSQTATGCAVTGVVATSATTFTVTVSGCSEGTVTPTILANAAMSASGVSGPGSDTDATSTTVDLTAPSAPTMSIAAGTSSGPALSDGGVTVEDGIRFTAGPSSNDASSITYSCELDGGAVQTPCPSSFGPLADGEHTLIVWSTDGAGNVSPSTSHTWTQVGPPIPVLAPFSDTGTSNSDRLTSDDTPTIELAPLVEGTTVTLRAQMSGQADVTCTFTVTASDRTCELPLTADGVWTVAGQVTDPQGTASSWSAPLSITVDTSAPSAPSGVDLVASSDTGSSSSDDLTADTTPRIDVSGGTTGELGTVTATPSGGGSPLSCSFVVGSDTGCELPEMSDGTWSISATFVDSAGNVSTAAPVPGLDIEIDSSTPGAGAPALAASSDTGTSSSDGITSVTSPVAEVSGLTPGDDVMVTATDGVSTVTCSFIATASTGGCALNGLTDGSWTVTSTVTDPAGNVASTGPSSVEIDTAAPAAPGAPDLLASSDSGTADDDDVTNDTTPSIDGGGSDGDLVTVTATPVAGGASVTCHYLRSATVQSCALPTMTDGDWSVTSTLTDPAGNASTSGPATVVTIDASAPSAPATPDLPATSDTGTDDGDDLTALTSFPIQIRGGLTNGDEVTVFATDGSSTATCSFVASPTVSSCTLSGLTDGAWTVSATAVDSAGNRSDASGALDIVVRSAAPSSPAVSVDGAETVGSAYQLTGDLATIRVEGPVAGDEVTVSANDGTRTVSCTYVASADTDGCALIGLDSGVWTVTTEVTDPFGRSASSSMNLTTVAADDGVTASGECGSAVVCEDWVGELTAEGLVLRPKDPGAAGRSVTVRSDDPSVRLTAAGIVAASGGRVELVGRGYTQGETITIRLSSDGTVLGTATVGADGSWTLTVTLPAPGDDGDRLSIVWPDGDTTHAASVAVGASTSTLPSTGGTDGAAVFVLIVALGALAVMLGSRRSSFSE